MMQILGEIIFFLCLKAIPAFFSLETVFTLQIATTNTKTYPLCAYRKCNAAVPYSGSSAIFLFCCCCFLFLKFPYKYIFPEKSIAASCV